MGKVSVAASESKGTRHGKAKAGESATGEAGNVQKRHHGYCSDDKFRIQSLRKSDDAFSVGSWGFDR